MQKKRWIVPLVAGLIIEGCFAAILALGNLRLQVPVFFVFYGIASIAYLAALWRCQHLSMMTIMAFAVVFRLTLVFSVPTLSDDIYRYVWDGRVQWAGINPYAFAPVDEELMHLRDAHVFPKINHAELPTIYPPVAQFVFGVGYGITGSMWGIKFLIVCADLVAGWLLVCLLRHFKQMEQWAVIYCWHPLVVLEVSGSGHIEGLGICAVLAAVLLFVKSRDGFALGVLGGAVLVKFLPLIFVPGLVRWRWWLPINWKAFFVLPCVVVAGYLPYAWTGAPLFGSLSIYAEHWSFNSPIFDSLYPVLDDGRLARGIIGVIFGGTTFVLIWMRASVLAYGFVVTAAFVVLTPTLHPWYVLWLIPFLVFNRNLAWIVFSILVALSYQILIRFEAEGVWEEALWVRWVEFGGLVCVMLLSLVKKNYWKQWSDMFEKQRKS